MKEIALHGGPGRAAPGSRERYLVTKTIIK